MVDYEKKSRTLYKYVCTKNINGITKYWGAYYIESQHKVSENIDFYWTATDTVVIFQGTIGKKVKCKVANSKNHRRISSRIVEYFNNHIKNGYVPYSDKIHDIDRDDCLSLTPDLDEEINKCLFWHKLKG